MRLIDTDKLLEKTECLFKDLNSTEDYMGIGYNHGVGDSIAIIKNAPTIEAEPVKHGRWEFEAKWQYKNCDGRGMERKEIFGTTKRTFNRLKCSKCKMVVVIDDTIAYAYCPHCGAKMDTEGGETHEIDRC